MKRLRVLSSALLVFAAISLVPHHEISAQTPTALPAVDLNRFAGSWYEVSHLPDKREKGCIADVVDLVALADKPGHLELVNACQARDDFRNVINAGIRAQKGSGGGKLKVTYLWPFSEKEWILDLGPDYDWVVLGTPNHKLLRVLSRTRSLPPELLMQIKQKAATEGYATEKMLSVLQTGR